MNNAFLAIISKAQSQFKRVYTFILLTKEMFRASANGDMQMRFKETLSHVLYIAFDSQFGCVCECIIMLCSFLPIVMLLLQMPDCSK